MAAAGKGSETIPPEMSLASKALTSSCVNSWATASLMTAEPPSGSNLRCGGQSPAEQRPPPSDNSLREAPLYTYNGAPSPATFVGTARPTKSARRDPATPVRLAAASLTIMSSAGGSLGTASKTMRERFD